jgi:hypothetical protein
MALLSNAAALANDPDFRNRVTAAAVGRARSGISNPDAGIHAINFARAIVQNPTIYVHAFAWAIATDPAIASLGATGAAVPDEAILASMQPVWAAMAGNSQSLT